MMNPGKTVFDFSKRDKDLLAIECNCLFKCRLRVFVIGAIASASKNWQRNTWAKRPCSAFPIEKSCDVAAQITARTRQRQHWKKRGLCNADFCVGRRELTFGF